ncbi:MAG: hypothetical protein EXR80_07555 [Methylococcales bacterium]|nr:hypothetical protein [Methylococcales bacterium]
MPKNQRTIPLSVILLSLSVGGGSALADDDIMKKIEDALKIGRDGGIKIDTRYRYENVNQDNTINPATGKPLPLAVQPQTANANTIRTSLGVLSPTYYGVQGYVEYEGMHVLQSDYNNGRGNKPLYSTVADPDWNELNQLWLSYSGIPDTVIKGGRQRIKFDDDRFIGNVGWRQLETTFDSVLITNKSLNHLVINVGYIGHVSTFTATNEDIRAPILNINYNMGDYGNLIGYGYWLGYTQPDTTGRSGTQTSKSNQTYGIRVINPAKPTKKFMEHCSPLYTAEWSIQQDYINSPVNYTANRYNLMGGLRAYDHYDFMAGMEQLNGHGVNQAFVTPLGTNHAFQGWADLFLNTPKDGIRDVYGTIVGRFLENESLAVTGTFHAFSDDTGQINYGKEWDFQAEQKFGKHYSVLVKYAYFDNAQGNTGFNAGATDTQRIWVQGAVSF